LGISIITSAKQSINEARQKGLIKYDEKGMIKISHKKSEGYVFITTMDVLLKKV